MAGWDLYDLHDLPHVYREDLYDIAPIDNTPIATELNLNYFV